MEKSFSLLDLATLGALGMVIIHLWGLNSSLNQANEQLKIQLQHQQSEMRGLERGVIISK